MEMREKIARMLAPNAWAVLGTEANDIQYKNRRRASLRQADIALTAIGETHVLVPREPTEAMQNAGWREIDKQGFQTEDTEVAPIYRAMLAAAKEGE